MTQVTSKSTGVKTTAKKPTTRKRSTVKTAAAATSTATKRTTKAAASAVKAAPKPVVVTESTPVVTAPAMNKKELIDTVTERSGIKKKFAKPVVEAMLAVLGQAIADERELNLQPLGKVKVNRAKQVSGAKVSILKIRQSDRQMPPKDPLAEAAE